MAPPAAHRRRAAEPHDPLGSAGRLRARRHHAGSVADRRPGVTPANPDYIVLSGDVPAAANQLGGDWTATVTNLSTHSGTFNVTVRYPVVAGNLGKVDHIIVVMMENRSFDHMLGYLKLTGANTDVDGLTGNEFNRDPNGVVQKVSLLPTTQFINDPGHGWTDVAGPLPAAPAGSVTASSCTGMSPCPPAANQAAAGERGPVAAERGSRRGPVQQCRLHPGLRPTARQRSLAGAARPIGHRGRRFDHDRLPAKSNGDDRRSQRADDDPEPIDIRASGPDRDLHARGDRRRRRKAHRSASARCRSTIPFVQRPRRRGRVDLQVTNRTDSGITVVTDISNVSATAAPGGEEPLPAIMGYYNKLQLPNYHFLASQ